MKGKDVHFPKSLFVTAVCFFLTFTRAHDFASLQNKLYCNYRSWFGKFYRVSQETDLFQLTTGNQTRLGDSEKCEEV